MSANCRGIWRASRQGSKSSFVFARFSGKPASIFPDRAIERIQRMSGDRPTRALVLAAGLGQRMRLLTDSVPKPLVWLAGRPLLDHVLDRLAEAGIAEAVVNVHYLPDQIEAH